MGTFAHWSIITFLLSSCAQVVAPGGGPRDEQAPKVVRYSPDSAQLNFNAKNIQIDFDEYIQLKDLNSQLLISPPFEKTPEIKVKSKSLSIDLTKETLKPNTTYSINFGTAIQDLNEGNPAENFRYIFSTGSFIDSLKLTGKVQTAFEHKVEKGILVMLYSSTNDSAVYLQQPDFFGKTSPSGTFEINNVRPGKYKIYALKDANGNYKYDGEGESIGFFDELVDPSENKNIALELFEEPSKKVFIKKSSHPSYGKIMIVFNQGSDSIHLTNLDNDRKGVQEYSEWSKKNDTVMYWIKNYDKDSLKLQVRNGEKVLDTLEFKMINKEDAMKAKRNPLKLSLQTSANGNLTYDINAGIKLGFNHPIFTIDPNAAIQLKEDSIAIKTTKPISYKTYYGNYQVVQVTQPDPVLVMEDPEDPSVLLPYPSPITLKENAKYELFVPPGTFTDMFGFTNDTIKVSFKTREQKYYGTLALKVHVKEEEGKKYIVQLLNERETIVKELSIGKDQVLTFDFLPPSKYRVRIICDFNMNDKWDTGDLLKKAQPEKVIYNSEMITIRSNWDADISWDVKLEE